MKISTLPIRPWQPPEQQPDAAPQVAGQSSAGSAGAGDLFAPSAADRTLLLAKPVLRTGELNSPPEGEPAIPDVRGMLARNPRFSELNLGINTAYVALADIFQNIYDPERRCAPSWYGFAPFASREAGRGIARAERLTELLEKGLEPPPNPEIELHFQDADKRTLANFLLALLGPRGPQPDGLGDLVHLTIGIGRLERLLDGQSGTLAEKLARVARTARNMLEDGNRRIVSEIGVAGQDYLQFRRGRRPTPEQVLDEFAARPAEARKVYQAMQAIVEGDGPLVTDWGEERFQGDRASFLDACFAAYEAARLETDPGKKNRWLQQAGVLMAYREQFDTVSPAFGEQSADLDEIPRRALMQVMTPWVEVPTRDFLWTFESHARANLPPRDGNPFTPRVTEYNWAEFGDRWHGILGFFDSVFQQPETLWPMPDPDPNVPL